MNDKPIEQASKRSIFSQILFLWLRCSKPEVLNHHSGNYTWTAFKIIGPFYVLARLTYED